MLALLLLTLLPSLVTNTACMPWPCCSSCNELSCTALVIQSIHAQHATAGEPELPLQVAGFVGLGFPEYLVKALRKRFDSTQHPQNLHIVAVAACGDGKGRGLDELAVDGLVSTATFGWAGLSPKLLKMITAKKIDAWNLPLGVGRPLTSACCNRSHTSARPFHY